MKRIAAGFFICAIAVAAIVLWHRLASPVTLTFPDFPHGVAMVDLGQNLTIKVAAKNDGGKGVTWSCAGDACTELTSTSKWATFYAGGLTGTAKITARAIRQPAVTQSITVIVHLNAAADMLCDGALVQRDLPPAGPVNNGGA